MAVIRAYYNPNCASCARQAAWSHRLDWLRRIEFCTDAPPSGPLPMGAIAVEDLRNGTLSYGAAARRRLCLQIPAYFLVGVLLSAPFVASRFAPEETCQGEACAAPGAKKQIHRLDQKDRA